MGLAHGKKVIFILSFFMVLLSLVFQAHAQETDTASLEKEIIEKKIKTDEIKSIEEAIDNAIKKSEISRAYNFNSEEILKNAIEGMPLENLKGLPKILLSVVDNEIKANIALVLKLFIIMILGAVIRALQPLREGIPNEAARLGINGIIVLTASVSFGSMANVATNTISYMQNIASLAMPALIALMASSGQIISVTAMQPLMLVGVNIACQIFKNILLPLAVMAGLLFLIDSISERFNIKTLAKLFKSCTVWITGTLTLVFSIAVTIQKLASSSVDAVALRTTKFAISTFVPVAGKYMSEAADTILLCTLAVRNAAGILTVIGLALIFAIPFIKVFIVMLAFRLVAAFGSPICDECICDALEDASSCFSVILGIMCAALFVLILLTGTVMNTSGLMR